MNCLCVQLNCCDLGCSAEGLCASPPGALSTETLAGTRLSVLDEPEQNEDALTEATTCNGCLLEGACLDIGETSTYRGEDVLCKKRRQVIFIGAPPACTDDLDCPEGTCIQGSCTHNEKSIRESEGLFSRILASIREALGI